MSIGLLATGYELTTGHVLNTNSQWLAKTLYDDHLFVHCHMVCDDRYDNVQAVLSWLMQRHALIIVTGGLGPTSDDITREVVADVLSQPLCFRPDVMTQVNDARQQQGKSLLHHGNKQFLFPEDALLFPNTHGTAWGFCCAHQNGTTVYVLPGPPHEMQAMFLACVLPAILKHHQRTPHHKIRWCIKNACESSLHQYMLPCMQQYNVLLHTCIHENKICDLYIDLPTNVWSYGKAMRLVRDIEQTLDANGVAWQSNHQWESSS